MAATDQQNTKTTAAMIFAVFAVVCIVAFLTYRGSDIGQLPKLIGNLGGGALFGTSVVDSFAGIVIAALIGVSWCGLGSTITKFVKREVGSSKCLEVALTTAIGAAIWSLIWFVLGLAADARNPYGQGSGRGAGFLSFIWSYSRVIGLYSTPIALAAILIGFALAIVAIRRRPGSYVDTNEAKKHSIFENVLLFVVAFTIALTLIGSLAPPTAKDTLLYHFAVPKAFIGQGGSGPIDGNIASYLALGTEMHSVWAMLLGNILSPRAGEAAADVTAFLFFPLLLLVVYGWAREIKIFRSWALVTAAIVATVPTACHVASSGYIDLSLALYVTLAAYGLTRWWKEQTWGWAILIGIFLGAALSIKLTSVFVFAAFVLVMLIRARGAKSQFATAIGTDTRVAVNPGKIVMSGLAAFVLAAAIASPWYIRTWVATGSPVFPFYMSIWPGKANGWDVERSNLFQAMNSQYGDVDADKLNYVTAPVRASIVAQPEQHDNYDGVLGVAFLIGLPLLVGALWKFDLAVEIKLIAGIAGVMYLFWLFSSEQLRYLLPMLPLLAIAIVASAEKIGNGVAKVARCALIAACVCGLLTGFAWFCQKAPLRVVLGGETRDQYLTRNLDYYPYYQWINSETPPDAKVWLINMRRDSYNIERPIFSDYLFEDWTFRKMLWESRTVQELRAKTAAMNIQYVLARHDLWIDYDGSTLVDDKKPRAENEAKLKIAREFILDPANTIKADNKFSLIKVF
jgi:hypothetical protein